MKSPWRLVMHYNTHHSQSSNSFRQAPTNGSAHDVYDEYASFAAGDSVQHPVPASHGQRHFVATKSPTQKRPQSQRPATQRDVAPQHTGRESGAPEADSRTQTSKYHRFFSLNVYGSKAALNFVPDQTKDGFNTVSLEAADMLNPAARTYKWDQKTRLQFTRAEYLEVVAVLLGIGANPACKFGNHGVKGGAKKGFEMKHQGNSVFVSVSETGKNIKAVPIPLMEAIQIGHMMMSVYLDNYPGLTTDSVITSLNLAMRRRDSSSTLQNQKT